MGAGRKTSTYDYDTKSAAQSYQQSFAARQRNLGEQLGGAIFGCTQETMKECLDDMVFGLPRIHWCYVQWIAKGMPIFLFNYNTKHMHGIFRATTDGEWEIKPDGWCKGSGTKTQFPSQVRVEEYSNCEPLLHTEWKPVIPNCILDDNHIVFELKKSEAQALCRLFDEKTNGKRTVDKPMPNATGANTTMAREKRQPFRPASPPAVPAWGVGTSSDGSSKTAEIPQEVPQPSDFPSLLGTSAPVAVAKAAQTSTSSNSTDVLAKKVTGKATKLAQERLGKAASSDSGSMRREAPTQKAATGSRAGNAGSTTSLSKAKLSKGKATGTASQPSEESIEQGRASAPTQHVESGLQDDGGDASQSDGWGASSQDGNIPQTHDNVLYAQEKAESAARLESSQPLSAASHHQQAAASQQANGSTEFAAADEFMMLLQAMHMSLREVNSASADALWHLLNSTQERLDKATQERMTLAHAFDVQRKERAALQMLVFQQAQAIETLKEEAVALRRDLAFVGGHINITVAETNPAVEALPPFSSLLELQKDPYEAGHPNLGVGAKSQSLLILGGNSALTWVKHMDVFRPSKKQWAVMGDMPDPLGYGAAAAIGPHIYAVGGFKGSGEWNGNCLRYDVLSDEWVSMEAMEEGRGSLAAVALGDNIYAIGGGKSNRQSNGVEILDTNINKWMRGKKLLEPRFAVAATAIGEAIYAVGGFNGNSYLDTCERYDPREGRWFPGPTLEHRRGGHSLIAAETTIYSMGGLKNADFLSSVEIFDLRKNRWRTAASMQTPHAYFGAAYLDGRIYSLCGMISQHMFNEVIEEYNMHSDSWTTFSVEPKAVENVQKRAFAACCTIDEP